MLRRCQIKNMAEDKETKPVERPPRSRAAATAAPDDQIIAFNCGGQKLIEIRDLGQSRRAKQNIIADRLFNPKEPSHIVMLLGGQIEDSDVRDRAGKRIERAGGNAAGAIGDNDDVNIDNPLRQRIGQGPHRFDGRAEVTRDEHRSQRRKFHNHRLPYL